jgi:hypothetical protein
VLGWTSDMRAPKAMAPAIRLTATIDKMSDHLRTPIHDLRRTADSRSGKRIRVFDSGDHDSSFCLAYRRWAVIIRDKFVPPRS